MKKESSLSSHFGTLFGVIVLILIVTLSIAHFNNSNTPQVYDLKSLLEVLRNAPEVSLNVDFTSGTIGGSWGVFDFFRVFLNDWVLSPLMMACGLLNVIVGAFAYFLYFLECII